VTAGSSGVRSKPRVNDRDLVADAWLRVDRTGVRSAPEFTGRTEILRITVTCRR
jgi:hypothetical protein